MSLSLSRRAASIAQAEIRSMSIECERVGGINLAQGVCDTEAPQEVRRGAQAAVDLGINSDTRFDGPADLRRAIAAKMGESNGIVSDPETDIIVSAGSTGAFYCACPALLDPGVRSFSSSPTMAITSIRSRPWKRFPPLFVFTRRIETAS